MTRNPTDPLPDHFGTNDWEDADMTTNHREDGEFGEGATVRKILTDAFPGLAPHKPVEPPRVSDTAVTREDAISFLESACRNWWSVPRLSEEDLRDVAMALTQFLSLRTSGGVTVKVKDLEWGGPDVNGEWHARSILAVYTVRKQQGSLGFWLTEVGGYHATLSKAKAAAQADYEQRILSAIEPAGVTDDAED